MQTTTTRAFMCALTTALAAGAATATTIAGQGTWQQTLQPRDLDGHLANGPEAYHDTVLDITWLADTQAIAGTRWDTNFRDGPDDQPFDNESNGTDGRALLSDAFFWVNQLEVGGVRGWRLPRIEPIDGVAYRYGGSKLADGDTPFGGKVDLGWNVTSTHSELAHLFHVTLGNLGAYDAGGKEREASQRTFNTGVFDELKLRKMWSGSKFRADLPDTAWVFDFATGRQLASMKTLGFPDAYHVWAVHDGDVGAAMPVPEPATWATLLAGLLLLTLARRRRAQASLGR